MSSKILIIDDNTDFAESIADVLKMSGYETEIASNGKEALKKIWLNKYNLILLDINMPEMSGKGFMEKLNQQKYSMPTIVVSGMDINEIKNYFFEQGAISYLKKPFNNSTLISLVKNTLNLTNRISIDKKSSDLGISVNDLIQNYHSLGIEDQEFIDDLLKIVHKHMLNNQFSVKFVSEKISYSRRQFNRKVKKYFNKTPHEVLSILRFKMIHNLIVNNDLSLSEVSEKLGFSSSYYFKKLYEKYINQS
ncbi:response regulator [Gracilimonas halophila]|uniref:Response regulator n=1 Tax=Gracilimonas halophila TaxID=1834464 RepID=A0ABW5JJL6_9BACT